MKKIHFFSFQGTFFNKKYEIFFGSTVLWKYGHLFLKIRKKYDEFKDFLVSVLVDHFSDLPI